MNSLELIVSEVRRLQATGPVGRKLIVSICGMPCYVLPFSNL